MNVTTLAKHRTARGLLLRGARRSRPGAYTHEIVRTKFIDEVVLGEVAAGLDELILLGAGFHSRAYRLAEELRGVRVIEVDHPASQASKRIRLRRLLGHEPEHVTFVGVDFTCDDLDAALAAAGHESAEIRFLEPLEVRALTDAAVDGSYREIDRAMYLTAAMTGLRQGELVALRWRDVDWTAGRIRVRQNYVLGEFGTPKSRRSTRSVPMADEVAGEIDRLSRMVEESSGDALVFADPHTAGPLDKAAILRRYRRAQGRAA